MEVILRSWRGEERLWKAWWYLGLPVLGMFALYNNYIGPSTEQHRVIVVSVAALLTCVFVLWAVCIVRCANNTSYKLWGILAELVLFLWLLNIGLSWLNIFVT